MQKLIEVEEETDTTAQMTENILHEKGGGKAKGKSLEFGKDYDDSNNIIGKSEDGKKIHV